MALVTHRWYGRAIVVGKGKNNVFVSYRGPVTKVAPECLRQASVAEQMSWDITTKEKFLFVMALEKENLSWEEPCGVPFSEPPVAEKDNHSEDETQVDEPDPVTEESRDVVHEPLRLPQRRLTSKQPPPSAEQGGRNGSEVKKGTSRCV